MTERDTPHPARGRTAITVVSNRSVVEAIASPTVEVVDVSIADDAPASIRKRIVSLCNEHETPIELVSRSELSRRSRQPRHDQGVCARIRLMLVSEVEQFVDSITGKRAANPTRVIALDGITNPQNIGMIVRSAAAAGIDAILWPLAGSPWIDGLVIKSSAATIYRMRVIRTHTLEEGLHELKRSGFRTVGLDARAGRSLYSLEPLHRVVIVIGSETLGLTETVRKLVDELVEIPIHPDVESLNAAAAATLACFHVTGRSHGKK